MEDVGSLFKRMTFIAKLVELLLEIISSAIVGNKAVALTTPKTHVVFVAIMGYMVVNIICLASYVMKTHLHKHIYIAVALSGAAMSIAAGACMIEVYQLSTYFFDYILGAGICSLINGAVYLVDAVFSFREGGS